MNWMRLNWMRFSMIAVLITGCSPSPQPSAPSLTLATTTSTRDSGLLDVLVPLFETETGITVKVVAVGSGQALELARRGDADVLLTHAPGAEQQFMDDGHGDQRHPVMHNDFVLVGPKADPAGIGDEDTVAGAFQLLAQNRARFVSRGDESGTHMKEVRIWALAKIDPQGPWCVRAGTGMAGALRIANEKQAYTLCDRGTFLAQREALDLVILSEGDPQLHNPYSVVVVSREKHPDVNYDGASRFSEFLRSPRVQVIIGKFGGDRFGQSLFFPRAPSELEK